MNHFPFLFAAYTIFWIVIFFYVITIDRRGRCLEREVEALKRARSAEPPTGS